MVVPRLSFLLAIYGALLILKGTGTSADAVSDDPDDPNDLTYLSKGAAIGDSYAAGIGAGNRLNWGCSRYDGSYPNLVALQAGTSDFTFTACSGAVISDVKAQADALSTGQQFVIVSAGGNDANLVGILNLCVFNFFPLSLSDCDTTLAASGTTIQSRDFAAKVDDLISTVKSKITSDGNIYYVGYAKFFDTTDNGCDKVSWHMWLKWFGPKYLTLARRTTMNDLVDKMNQALKAAVDRAGDQVHFIDYDDYVDLIGGRYCQPGDDESAGKSANRADLFFYEMKSEDSPWLNATVYDWHTDLKRRQDAQDGDGDLQPANNTLNALYGALIQEAIQNSTGVGILVDENVDNDLENEVHDEESLLSHRRARRHPSDNSIAPRHYHFVARSAQGVYQNSTNGTVPTTVTNSSAIPSKSVVPLAQVPLGSIVSAGRLLSNNSSNTTLYSNITATGTVISNDTHMMLGSGKVVEKSKVFSLFVSDMTGRVFHPTQAGHSLIANLILYEMAAQNAKRLGIDDFPPALVNTSGLGWPEPGGAACSTSSSDTWANRDSMVSAVNDFCADPQNLGGTSGEMTSRVYNINSFDYMNISVTWKNNASIGQHSCSAWLDVVTDGCDVPSSSDQNAPNWKHGGIIPFQVDNNDAIMQIEPLVVRQIWDKGQAGGQQCNDLASLNYLDQGTLQANIQDYCTKSAAQPGGIANASSVFSQTFNDGTPDRVVLTTAWPPGPRNYQIFHDECQYYMSVINNGCHIPDGSNPMNWKHGGSLTDKNGVKYSITPTQTRPAAPRAPVGDCAASRQPWGYAWSVTGGGFANSDWGGNLLAQIRGCGAVTSWTFRYFDAPSTDVPGTEWIAGGTLPLWISDHCLAKAVKSAGGFPSNC